MDCPFCGDSSKVTDSRPGRDGVRRRRHCERCNFKFSTLERVLSNGIRVNKVDGRPAEDFQKEKLLVAVKRVCKGCGVPVEEIAQVANDIEMTLIRDGFRAVHSQEIAKMVFQRLETLSEKAYLRFSANYREPDGRLTLVVPVREVSGIRQFSLFD